MKLTLFYILLVLPLIGYLIFKNSIQIDSKTFVAGLFTYLFLYHPAICGLKLVSKKEIKWSEFHLNFIPTWNFKYFNTIFLKN